jgi:ribosomal protein S18 acetylase RimI-like enzyme
MKHEIIEAKPDGADVAALIAELDVQLGSHGYPRASQHGYSVEKLLREAVAFFVIRCDGVAAGCGGVQLYGTEYAELKRMYVRPSFRRLGLGRAILDHLADHARRGGAAALRLETGIYQEAAIALYESIGFRRRSPFGAYREDPFSLYFEMKLD